MKTEYLIRQKSNPGSLLNTDNKGKEAYLLKRAKQQEKNIRLDVLEEKVNDIDNTLKKILELLEKDK